MLKKVEIAASSFDSLILRHAQDEPHDFNDLTLMVSLSRFGRLTVSHRPNRISSGLPKKPPPL
jgi:hypothetical protein